MIGQYFWSLHSGDVLWRPGLVVTIPGMPRGCPGAAQVIIAPENQPTGVIPSKIRTNFVSHLGLKMEDSPMNLWPFDR